MARRGPVKNKPLSAAAATHYVPPLGEHVRTTDWPEHGITYGDRVLIKRDTVLKQANPRAIKYYFSAICTPPDTEPYVQVLQVRGGRSPQKLMRAFRLDEVEPVPPPPVRKRRVPKTVAPQTEF